MHKEHGKISFNNFKPFGEKMQTFSKKPITLIYGANSIGKTSLLELLAYKYEVRNNFNFDISELTRGDTLHLGGFENFINKKDRKKKLRLNYDLTPNSNVCLHIGKSDSMQNAYIEKITYSVNKKIFLEIEKNCLKIDINNQLTEHILNTIKENGGWSDSDISNVVGELGIIKYQFKNNNLIDLFITQDRQQPIDDLNGRLYQWNKLQEDKKVSIEDLAKSANLLKDVFPDIKFDFDSPQAVISEISNPSVFIQFYLLNHKDTLSLKHILIHLTIDANRKLDAIFHKKQKKYMHIGAFRFFPERYSAYLEKKELKNNSSEDFWKYLQDKPKQVEKLNDWLNKLDTPYMLDFKKLYNFDNLYSTDKITLTKSEIESKSPYVEELVFIDKISKVTVQNMEIGLGIAQVLPIVGNLMEIKNHTISIEHPEMNVNNKLHSKIADEIINSYLVNNNEFLIETHSKGILKRIIQRIKNAEENFSVANKSSFTYDDICVLYLDRDKNGEVQINEIDLTQNNSLDQLINEENHNA